MVQEEVISNFFCSARHCIKKIKHIPSIFVESFRRVI